MTTLAEKRGRTERHAKRRRGYFYKVSRDSLGALAERGDYRLTLFSPKKLKGIRNQNIKEAVVSDFGDLLESEAPMVLASEVANEAGDIAKDAYTPGARARMILRGIKNAEADLAEAGGTFDLSEVRRVMRGISRQMVDRKFREGSLLAVPGPSNRRVYPTIQFNSDGSLVEGIKDVQKALAYESPWSVLNFLMNESDGLDGERPVDALRRGEVDRVVRVARAIGVQGT
jgi:hypothetical protein